MTAKHEGVISLSTIRRPQPDPQPEPVNEHPGPDFPRRDAE